MPTTGRNQVIDDKGSRILVKTLRENCEAFGVPLFDMNDPRQGIVHVIGPEQGFTQPGTTIVCGDAHAATHGAFGALAFAIGITEVENVLATQTLFQQRGWTSFSTMTTSRPRRARKIAVAAPPGPPPITSTSQLRASPGGASASVGVAVSIQLVPPSTAINWPEI